MRKIKVTFRAVFRQPIGVLNPIGLTVPGEFPVEIFQKTTDKWACRSLLGKRLVFHKLGDQPTLETMQVRVESCFQEHVQGWQVWGTPPAHHLIQLPERMLLPEEICDLGDGKYAWYTEEDFTHILDAHSSDRVPPAACGARLKPFLNVFIDARANVEPTCPGCKEVWEREYKGK